MCASSQDDVTVPSLSPEERYRRDPEFRVLVDMLYASIERAQYTPTELRETVVLAATKYAFTHAMPPRTIAIDPEVKERILDALAAAEGGLVVRPP
jgi:hypothetical protein